MKAAWVTFSRAGDRSYDTTLQGEGFERIFHVPLLTIQPLPFQGLKTAGGLALLTSGHAVEVLAGGGIAPATPIITLGPTTAQRARALGFTDVHVAGGRARDIPSFLGTMGKPLDTPLVYYRGVEVAFPLRAALEAAGYQQITEEVVYQAVPMTVLPHDLLIAWQVGELQKILLFSPRGKATLHNLAEAYGLSLAAIEVWEWYEEREGSK